MNVSVFREELRNTLNEAGCPVSDTIADGVQIVDVDGDLSEDALREAAYRYGQGIVSMSGEFYMMAQLSKALPHAGEHAEVREEYEALLNDDGSFNNEYFAEKIVEGATLDFNDIMSEETQDMLIEARTNRLNESD